MDSSPQLLFALAAALNGSCTSGIVTPATAAALQAVLPELGHLSLQFSPEPGCSVNLQPLHCPGACTARFFHPRESPLFTECITSRAAVSRSRYGLPGEEAHGCARYVAIPLLVDPQLSLLGELIDNEASGCAAEPKASSAAASHVLDRYLLLSEAGAPCVGSLTIGVRNGAVLGDRTAANLGLLASVASLHLVLDAEHTFAAAADGASREPEPGMIERALDIVQPVADAILYAVEGAPPCELGAVQSPAQVEGLAGNAGEVGWMPYRAETAAEEDVEELVDREHLPGPVCDERRVAAPALAEDPPAALTALGSATAHTQGLALPVEANHAALPRAGVQLGHGSQAVEAQQQSHDASASVSAGPAV